MAKTATRTVLVRNVIRPKSQRRVDARLYTAMKRAYLAVLPSKPPGLTPTAIAKRVRSRVPRALYPTATKAGWWSKLVQLDLEAKRVIARNPKPPVRLYKSR